MRHRSYQVIDPKCQPRPVELLLETCGERGLPWARAAIQDDDLDVHLGEGNRL